MCGTICHHWKSITESHCIFDRCTLLIFDLASWLQPSDLHQSGIFVGKKMRPETAAVYRAFHGDDELIPDGSDAAFSDTHRSVQRWSVAVSVFKFQFQKYNQHWPTLFKMCWIFWQLNVPESKLNTFSMFSRDWAASRQESIWSINKQLVHSWHWICARVVLHPKCSEQTRLKIRSFHCLVRFKIGQFVGTLAMLLAVAAVYFTTDSQTQTQLGTELEHVEPEKSTDLDPIDSRPVIYFDSDEYVVPSTCLTAMLRLASTNALAGGWGSQNWTTWGGNQTAFHSHPETSTRNQMVNSIHGHSWPA